MDRHRLVGMSIGTGEGLDGATPTAALCMV